MKKIIIEINLDKDNNLVINDSKIKGCILENKNIRNSFCIYVPEIYISFLKRFIKIIEKEVWI